MKAHEAVDLIKEYIKLNQTDQYPDEDDIESWLFGGVDPRKKMNYYKIEGEDRGGGTNQGSLYWMVVSVKDKITKEKVYVRFTGHYESHAGVLWNKQPTLVEPKKVKITTWEQV